jgi:uncharacterized protein YbaP (TraB family)
MTFVIFALLALAPAFAAPVIHAHPALWHVQGPEGEAYLFGSIHLLPKNIDWHTKRVDAAIKRADVFVFEVATDDPGAEAEIRGLIAEKGMLPAGESLRAMLPPASRSDYDGAIAKAHLMPQMVDHEKPWLVSLQLLIAEGEAKHFSAAAGVDNQVMAIAAKRHKPARYFETIEQQMNLLAGSSDKVQLSEFESDLKDFQRSDDDLTPMVDAWKNGQEGKLAGLMNEDLTDDPEMKKALLTDRNRNWVAQIEKMLTEKKVFFITVGAGHLAGPDGVPALLRAAGYKVERL